jgi:hypothetical protein
MGDEKLLGIKIKAGSFIWLIWGLSKKYLSKNQ